MKRIGYLIGSESARLIYNSVIALDGVEKPIEIRAEGWDMSEKVFQDVDGFLLPSQHNTETGDLSRRSMPGPFRNRNPEFPISPRDVRFNIDNWRTF